MVLSFEISLARSLQESCTSAADVVDLLDSPLPAEKPNDSQSPAAGCLTLLDYPERPESPEQPAESLLEESQVEETRGLAGHSEIPATQKDKDEESDDAGERAAKGAFQDCVEFFLWSQEVSNIGVYEISDGGFILGIYLQGS